MVCETAPILPRPQWVNGFMRLIYLYVSDCFTDNGTSAPLSQGLYSLSGKTSYRKISWSLEAARFGFKLFQSLWNLAGTSAALLPRCLSNFRAIRPLQISRFRDFTRFGGKTSYRLVNRGPASVKQSWKLWAISTCAQSRKNPTTL